MALVFVLNGYCIERSVVYTHLLCIVLFHEDYQGVVLDKPFLQYSLIYFLASYIFIEDAL